jgi:hypothetical protein
MEKNQIAQAEEKWRPPLMGTPVDDLPYGDVGWKHRTVLLLNIPEWMRSEKAIREYFHVHLRPEDPAPPATPDRAAAIDESGRPLPDSSNHNEGKGSRGSDLIQEVVLVRKEAELNDLYIKYKEALYQLESAHVALAENVMKWVKAKLKAEKKYGEGAPVAEGFSIAKLFWSKARKEENKLTEDAEKELREEDGILLAALSEFASGGLPTVDKKTGHSRSIWAALHSLDPIMLDRFQPLFKLKHFRGQAVPAIDYWLAKLNLIQRLMEDKVLVWALSA